MDIDYGLNREPFVKKFKWHVFVDQVGYRPNSVKRAVITAPCKSFKLITTNGDVAFSGKAEHFGFDENSGDDVYTADFSALTKSGEYTLVTDGGEKSLTIKIDEKAYEKVLDDTLKAFYFLRCGCELKPEHAGEYRHAECHSEKALLWNDRSVSLDVKGGWHDAGDYGRYVTAGACALAHLLYAFRLYPKSFEKRKLNIPESGSEVPDVLSECRYELEWMLKMQNSNGGVYHKATTANHAPFIMPEDDKAQMYALPVSSMATADFAAVCALSYGIFKEYDAAFADTLLAAAKKAQKWLEENPKLIFENPEECHTGTYGERSDEDNRFWAYAELYSATGDEDCLDKMVKLMQCDFPLTALGYGCVGGFGALSYILNEKSRGSELAEKFKKSFTEIAEELADTADKCGYGVAMRTEDYCWGSNMNVMKRGMIFAIADYIENGTRFKKYAEAQLHYLLGVNASGYSYVTGNGEFRCNYPHLRPAYADGIEECMPGMVSGGANRYPSDKDARMLIPEGTPPMKCYEDDAGCYSLNEITIYWNSPTVFTLAYVVNG